MKEKIISTLSTHLSVEDVKINLQQITVSSFTQKIISADVRYYGHFYSDYITLRDFHAGARSFRPNYLLKLSSSGDRTIIVISNDRVSRTNDSLGYMLVMASPIGLALALTGIYTTIERSDPSYGFIIFGFLLAVLPFVFKPKVKKKNFQEENDREVEWLCNYLDAVKMES